MAPEFHQSTFKSRPHLCLPSLTMLALVLLVLVIDGTELKANSPLQIDSSRTDSARIIHTASEFSSKDSLKKGSSGIDTVVSYYAADSAVFRVRDKTLRLRGNANTKYRSQKIESEVIEIHFDSGVMTASAGADSNGKRFGFPKFSDAGKEYAGEVIKYNFKMQAGTVSLGETTIDNAFFFGSRIRRNSDQSLFVENGCYTTCDHPHPHFYFSSPKMKVIPGDRILLNDVYLYVQDVPILYLPIGLFFPTKSGRQSGLLIPRPYVDANRGVAFQNLGYYFALSDYYDTQLTFDLYSKGGIQVNNAWNYNLRYVLDGNLKMSYAYVRPDPRTDYTKEYKLNWQHNQVFDPTTRFTANINFQSNDFNRNTLTTLAQRIQQLVYSSAGLTHTFDNNMSLSLGYTRNQDIQVKTYDQTPSISLNIPAFFPLKTLLPNSWLGDLSINATTSAAKQYSHSITNPTHDTTYFDTALQKLVTKQVVDTVYVDRTKAAWHFNPSISLSPKLGFVTLSPTISFSANAYPRRITRSFDTATKQPIDVIENGAYFEYSSSIGIGASSTLYGSPLALGRFAIRHTVRPQISLSYTPDFSPEKYGFYSRYQRPADSVNRIAQSIIYSRYELDGGGIASQSKSLALNWSLDNAFDAKIFGDSADRKVELFRLLVGSSYNFIKDSLKSNDISWTLRTPAIGSLSFNTNFTTTMYDEAPILDTNNVATGSYKRIDQTLLSKGKFPLRLTSFQFYLTTTIGSGSFSASGSNHDSTSIDTTHQGVGDRFRRRLDYQDADNDEFGDSSPGYTPLNFPWSATVNLNYSYNKTFASLTAAQNLSIQTSMNLSLTKSWSLSGGLNYDLLNRNFAAPSISIHKVIHCWQLDITWYPTGSYRGFYLSFSPTSSVLHDLKIEKRSSTYIQ